jgi:hypothetical protein
MKRQVSHRKSTARLNTHHDLQKMTEEQVRANGAQIVHDADQGIQTAIVARDGSVRAVVGLNCVRYLPDADPDPLDEIAWSALEAKVQTAKK